ncbi:DUF3558 domain-containing protein [Pseudonocardia saturnea]
MRRGAGWLIVLVLLVGCGTPPVAGSGAPAPSTSAAPTTIALPPRPREIRLDGLDPCDLLTETQRADLGLDRPPVFNRGPSQLYGGETDLCSVRGNEPRAVSVGVQLAVTAGIEVFTSRPVDAEVRVIDVRGFPAVMVVPTGFPEFCSVIVDVAPGQALDVQFADGGRRPPVPQPELCSSAEESAGLVMDTLLVLH